jgi:hypothetical protein
MDVDKELNSLHAETLAFGAILAYVFDRLARSDPALKSAISAGFDDAANFVEDFAIKRGKSASPEHTVKALRVVEDLRAATFGKQQKPGGIV